jgi:co-chaperonin GroES (HSP10)
MIRYAGKEVKDNDGSKYIIINDVDILCIIK